MNEIYEEGAYRTAGNILDLASSMKENDGSVLVFIHKSVDGDCVGSGCAVAQILRRLGVTAYMAMPEPLPFSMGFLDVEDMLFYPEGDEKEVFPGGKKYSAAISVDCTEGSRMGCCGALYEMFPDSITIDHHEITELATDLKWIMPKSASACEMVYHMGLAVAEMLKVPVDQIIDTKAARCIMAGVVTDTGRFTYSNTRPETLAVAGELMKLGGDISEVCYNLFDRKKIPEFYLSNAACVGAELHFGGKMAMSVVTRDMFLKYDAGDDDIADVVSRLRDINGVELAVVLRETEDGKIRGNLRSKSSFDCSAFAGEFNGGGHKRASGFTIENGNINDIAKQILDRAETML
ncbi:MAG: bifunctional oligoribonuclease/PAP phosphatase NrnA [Clostridiales bacterium]|nr:bifunctional oligoribonuclease/PAP phosphatase NrnA [Clostridiales bacterium]